MKKIICLYGGPGSGKSTTCSSLFSKLKMNGYNCEMNREYIKEWVWEGRKVQPGDQTYFFSKQSRRERLYMKEGLDAIITDSPLIFAHYYGLKYDIFEQMNNTSIVMLQHHHTICKYYGYKVEHYFLERCKPYNPAGRFQNEEDAKKIDKEIYEILNQHNINFKSILGNEEAAEIIYNDLIGRE